VSQERESGVIEEVSIKPPRKYKVILHNDNYTTMDFVVGLLTSIFSHSTPAATRVMLSVHRNGVGTAGVYSREIAEMKLALVKERGADSEQPIQCTMEPE
jgi:ATP-dependent Clp protease adaptor protein ClpS